MKRIGEVKSITGSVALIQADENAYPKIGTKVINERLESVGHIVDVVGPVSKPYIVVKIYRDMTDMLKKRLYSR
tara:strand:+ start:11990 stop:12211 length:222 start_codon:yes stop_codon:yes gene_type:complete